MIEQARNRFPRGLAQPEGGYRFSLDSLLLACFCQPGAKGEGADIGAGCGVVGLGLLLRHERVRLVAVERDSASVECARANGALLGLEDRFSVERADVAEWRPQGVLDFVVANPPYRELGRGRASRGEERKAARFEAEGNFDAFAACAARALKARGKFCFVHLPERLPALMAGLDRAGLEPKRMRLVHSRIHEPAKIVLMEARKQGGPGMAVEPTLVLYEGTGQDTAMTEQALDFCPYLRCNA